MSDTDFDEPVTLLAPGEPNRDLTLAEAVRFVVTAETPLAQLGSIITREGRPMLHFAEIEALYHREDFPR